MGIELCCKALLGRSVPPNTAFLKRRALRVMQPTADHAAADANPLGAFERDESMNLPVRARSFKASARRGSEVSAIPSRPTDTISSYVRPKMRQAAGLAAKTRQFGAVSSTASLLNL